MAAEYVAHPAACQRHASRLARAAYGAMRTTINPPLASCSNLTRTCGSNASIVSRSCVSAVAPNVIASGTGLDDRRVVQAAPQIPGCDRAVRPPRFADPPHPIGRRPLAQLVGFLDRRHNP